MLLKENPFYILDVSISADRKKIAEAAAEVGFLLGEEISREAQSILTNPTRRLNAEMAWFPDANGEDIASIRNAISGDQLINTSLLTGLSKQNAMVYNLGIAEHFGAYDLGFDIVAIDEQYNSIDLARLKRTINQAREKAGMSSVGDSEVQECHRKLIEDIRKLVSEKLKLFDEQSYIDFVTTVAEKYIADKRSNAGPILFDIVDQYEIKMQSEIDAKADQIIQYVDLIKAEQNSDIIRKSIPKVIERVKAWDDLAQPLQCRSQATGLPHQTSSKLAYEIRGLILFLNNEKHMVTEAKELAFAMKDVFVELGELKEVFTNDTAKLNEIEKSNQDAKIINDFQNDFKSIDDADKALINSGLEPRELQEFVRLVTTVDGKIRQSNLDKESKEKLRTALCYKARNTAINIHNDLHNHLVSAYLIYVLTDLFKDLAEPRKKLQEDAGTLRNNPLASSVTAENYRSFPDSYVGPKAMAEKLRKRKIIKRVAIAAAALIFIFFAISNSRKSNSSTYRSTSSNYGSSTNKNTTKPTTKPTEKPTTKKETAYTSSSKVGDPVYVNIVSVFPNYYTYESDSLNIIDFTCKCVSESGETVWVYFSDSEYYNNIDNNAPRFSSRDTKLKKIPFNPAVRIHGIIGNKAIKTATEAKNLKVIRFSSLDEPDQKTEITNTNINQYFNVEIVKKKLGKDGLTLSYSIKPKAKSYAGKKDSSSEIIIKFRFKTYRTKNETVPFKTKDYTVILKKSNGYEASGEVFMAFGNNMTTVDLRYLVVSCEGLLVQ